MSNIKFRVTIKISYYTAQFEFDNGDEAVEFAKTILLHQINTEDTNKKSYISLDMVDVDMEKKEEEEDE